MKEQSSFVSVELHLEERKDLVSNHLALWTGNDHVTSVCFFLGTFFVLPCIDEYSKIDLRTVSFDVPPQEVIK